MTGVQTCALPICLYNVKFSGEAILNSIQTVNVHGAATNVTVQGGVVKLSLELFVINTDADFVIMELFVTGTVTPENKQYTGDQYIKIYNNSDQTLYADGLFIAESQFLTTTQNDYSPNIMGTHFTAGSIFRVPGNGTTYPVAPGDSLIICDNAIDHREANVNSFDLRKANFEWYTTSTSSSNQDIDNPDVDNLEQLYCYSNTLWILNKQGNKAYVIGRVPAEVTPESFMSDYSYTCNYTLTTGATSKDFTYYKVPNEWIVDAVNLGPKNTYVWNLTSASLDMGFTYVGENAAVAENYGKAVRRKVALTQPDGRVVLQKTNNSSTDFNHSVKASELQ